MLSTSILDVLDIPWSHCEAKVGDTALVDFFHLIEPRQVNVSINEDRNLDIINIVDLFAQTI